MTYNNRTIKTQFVYPPIPVRSFDWCATYGDYDEGVPYEYGPSKEIAEANLIRHLWESGI